MVSMTARVEVPVELISWARERSGVSSDELARRFPKLDDWESGELAPTFKQLEDFANATHTPFGFFFLPAPPEVELPLPDFRTMNDQSVREPSADLLDTLFDMQQRQDWYRDFALSHGESPVSVVGSLTPSADIVVAARRLRTELHFEVASRGPSWSEAFRRLAESAEDIGVLVMLNGIVGSNTHRKLNPREFRGFALVDAYAPLVFVNGADTKAAQIFTLAHELAHIWVGQSALSDAELFPDEYSNDVEEWCNAVAAEMLVPAEMVRSEYRSGNDLTFELERLAGRFKVSTLVILRRLKDLRYLSIEAFVEAFRSERQRVLAFMEEREPSSGGNFYNTHITRTGKRFPRALITSAREGETLYRDAFRLLGLKKFETFNEFARRLGVAQ